MNKYQNIAKMIQLSEESFNVAREENIIDLSVRYNSNNTLRMGDKEFINMCSCSYLGLDVHPQILLGAQEEIQNTGSLHLTTARTRLYTESLENVEYNLGQLFNSYAISYVSCSAATSAFLPLLASGVFTDNEKPKMVFDKHCHFSMNHIKAICGDETEVVTAPHNDMEFLEHQCKENSWVAYVADGTYSIEGEASLEHLLQLQKKYNLFTYLDDSHGLSVTGTHGIGRMMSRLGKINERTVVVGSLAKAFGACGGVLLSGDAKIPEFLIRYGSPWSQYLNSAGIGGVNASIKIHTSNEIVELQNKWKKNLNILDKNFLTLNRYTDSPIRVIVLDKPESAIKQTKLIFEKGYYVSAVYFPIVPRGKAGLRIMPRANIQPETMTTFCGTVKDICQSSLLQEV